MVLGEKKWKVRWRTKKHFQSEESKTGGSATEDCPSWNTDKRDFFNKFFSITSQVIEPSGPCEISASSGQIVALISLKYQRQRKLHMKIGMFVQH